MQVPCGHYIEPLPHVCFVSLFKVTIQTCSCELVQKHESLFVPTGQNEFTTTNVDLESPATVVPPTGPVMVPEVPKETSINTPIPTQEVTVCDKGRSPRQKLRCHLLEHYDTHVHPVKDSSKAVTVAIGMAIIHLDIDEMKSVMGVDAWMRFDWKDEFLSWDPLDYDNLTQIHLAVGEIWKPDIFVYNR